MIVVEFSRSEECNLEGSWKFQMYIWFFSTLYYVARKMALAGTLRHGFYRKEFDMELP